MWRVGGSDWIINTCPPTPPHSRTHKHAHTHTHPKTADEKERGRRVEINNGRAAMLGIGGILSVSKVRSEGGALVVYCFVVVGGRRRGQEGGNEYHPPVPM